MADKKRTYESGLLAHLDLDLQITPAEGEQRRSQRSGGKGSQPGKRPGTDAAHQPDVIQRLIDCLKKV